MEFRAQAAHNGAYRQSFVESDQRIKEGIVATIRAGIEQGVFRAVDPDQVAEFVLYVVEGAIFRTTTTDGTALRSARAELDEYIDSRLVSGDSRS